MLDAFEKKTRADADTFTAEEIEALPRFQPKDGGSFLVIAECGMAVGGQVAPMHLVDTLRKHPGARVFQTTYEDCWRCRRRRHDLMQTEYGRTLFSRSFDYVRDSDTYWCNSCQGTGCLAEDHAKAVERYGIITWEMRAKALSNEELAAEMRKAQAPLYEYTGDNFPKNTILAEASRRLVAA